MSQENTHEQQPGRLARWWAKLAAKQTYNLALKDLKTTKKLLEKYKPTRTAAEKTAAAKELAGYQKNYALALIRGFSTSTVHRNEIYCFIARHLAPIKLEPEVKKFLTSLEGNISIIGRSILIISLQQFWDGFSPLSEKNKAKILEEILTSGPDHIDYDHIAKLFQEQLSHNILHTLLNNSYLSANTKQELLKLVFTSTKRNSEAFGKILFSQNSQLTTAEIRAVLPNKAEDLPGALTAAFRNRLNSSELTLNDKFFVLDIISSYNISSTLKNTDDLKQEIEKLFQIFYPQAPKPILTPSEGATFFPLIAVELNIHKIPAVPFREEYISNLCRRLGITEAETAEKSQHEKLKIITARVEQLSSLLKQKIAVLDVCWSKYGLSHNPAFNEKVDMLRKVAFPNTEIAQQNPSKQNLARFQKGEMPLYDFLKTSLLLDPDNHGTTKRAAFDHALTSEIHRPALAELALLPNDPYGARAYLEEKSHPGFWSRVSRKLFWWTASNKKEIELTNLAQDTLQTPNLTTHTLDLSKLAAQQNVPQEVLLAPASEIPAKIPGHAPVVSGAVEESKKFKLPSNTIKDTFQKVLTELTENDFKINQDTPNVSYKPVVADEHDPILLNSSTEDSPRESTDLHTAIEGLQTPPSGSPEQIRKAAESAAKDIEHISREATPTDPAKPQPLSAARKRNAEARGTNRTLFGNHG